MKVFPTETELGEDLNAAIGRAIVHWSFIEGQFRKMCYMLLQISMPHGRVAVRSPRADEHLSMIKQIIALDGYTVKSLDLDALSKSLRTLEKYRDLIAHGLWLRNPETGQLFVQDLSGTWKPEPNSPKVAKRIKPQGMAINASDLNALADQMKAVISAISMMHEELGPQVLASWNKRPQPMIQGRHTPDQTPAKPEPPL